MEIEKEIYTSFLEIDLNRIAANIERIKAYTGEEIIPVIKANAYGCGTVEMARFLVEYLKIDFIACARVDEACQIRRAGIICDIMLLGPTRDISIPVIVREGLQLPLFDRQTAGLLSEEARRQGVDKVKAQLKINSGMNRIGVRPGRELEELVKDIQRLDNIEIIGAYTHFATADEAHEGAGNDFTREQFALFLEALDQLEGLGVKPRYVHCQNTGACVWLKQAKERCTHVRCGSLYHGYSSVQNDWNPIGVEEAVGWKTYVLSIAELNPGETAGYGRAFKAEKPTRLAIIGVGYGDGYLRHLAVGHSPVLIGGKRYPFVAITMDQGFIDVTGSAVEKGDEVILFGEDDSGNRISGLEIGHLLGETRQAMFTHITERVGRVYKHFQQND